MNIKRKIMYLGLGIESAAVAMVWICVFRRIAVPSFILPLMNVGIVVTLILALAIRRENVKVEEKIKKTTLIVFLILLFCLTGILTVFTVL